MRLRRFEEEEPKERFAVDLGCGTGRDTLELLRRGWRVLAVDATIEAIERLLVGRNLSEAERDRLETRVSRFETAEWPSADLSTRALRSRSARPPTSRRYGRGSRCPSTAAAVSAAILFGDRDGWSSEEELTFHTRREAETLFSQFELELFDEVEEDGKTAVGKAKHWHLFHVVARRR